LGGGFVDTFGGDPTMGLANLAGSALLNPIQQAIGKALGLSEFRLFTTAVINDENQKRPTSTLGLAAEASMDVTSRLSISALKILTHDDPLQIGLRYRVNDEVLLRGSSNFSDDSRFMVEYESRF
jgi:translocation and assembly module TamB